jgi:hypothetical protein
MLTRRRNLIVEFLVIFIALLFISLPAQGGLTVPVSIEIAVTT